MLCLNGVPNDDFGNNFLSVFKELEKQGSFALSQKKDHCFSSSLHVCQPFSVVMCIYLLLAVLLRYNGN